ncbi:MAG: family 16 glycoside hydrolase [Akkermansiaceae bacterium]
MERLSALLVLSHSPFLNGALGDWYARLSLRIFADKQRIDQSYKADDWNRMTIRAKGNRVEYWMNGSKIIDYTDKDPKRSKDGFIGF